MIAEGKAKKIAATALRVLEREGPDAVTMRRVARACGVTAMAIYHHFPSRKAVLDAITSQEFEKQAALMAALPATGSIENRFEIVLDRSLDFALERPQVYDYVFSQRRAGAQRFPKDFVEGNSPTFNALANLVAEAMRTGFFRKGDVWETALTIAAQMQGMITLYRGGRFGLTEKEFRKLCKRTAKRQFDGLKKQDR